MAEPDPQLDSSNALVSERDEEADSVNDDAMPPLLPTKNPAVRDANSRSGNLVSGDVNVSRQRMILLTVLAGIPSVLLFMGLVLYWYDISNRQPVKDRVATNQVEGLKEDSKPAKTEDAVETEELTKYREGVAKLLFFTYLSVKEIRGRLDVKDRYVVNSGRIMHKNLTFGRNLIKAPPQGLKNAPQLEGQLDDIPTGFHRAMILVKNPEEVGKFKTVEQVLNEGREINGHGVPEPITQALDDVSQTADRIAQELELGFDKSHGSHRFAREALNFIARVRVCASEFEQRPVEPPANLLDFDINEINDTNITLHWLAIPAPPEGLANRQKIVSALTDIHSHTVRALRCHDMAKNSRKQMTPDDRVTLRKFSDDSLQNALRIADEFEPEIKKSRTP